MGPGVRLYPVSLGISGVNMCRRCAAVNDGRILTPFRRLKVDPLQVGRSSVFGSGRGRDAAEIAVFESVAVSFEGDDFGMVDEAVDHGCGDDVVTEHFAPAAELLVGGDDQAGPFIA